VERGYRFGLEDYRNDLDLRGILTMLGLDEEVRELDQRLESPVKSGVWETSAKNPFWDFGYPKNAKGELLEDLEKEDIST